MRVKLAALSLAIASFLLLPSFAEADSFQYDFTEPIAPGEEINIVFTITGSTLPTGGEVTSFTSTTDPFANVTAFGWASDASSGDCLNQIVAGIGCVAFLQSNNEQDFLAFPIGSFLSPGTYTGGEGVTLAITDLGGAVPEPSSLLLLGCGLLSLLAMAPFGGRIRRFAS